MTLSLILIGVSLFLSGFFIFSMYGKGVGTVEYALILILILVVLIAIITLFPEIFTMPPLLVSFLIGLLTTFGGYGFHHFIRK